MLNPAALKTPSPICRLLDADPDLGEGLARDAYAQARAQLIVSTLLVEKRAHSVVSNQVRTATHGLLVLDGYLTSTIAIAGRSASEILGPGDVLLPGVEEGSDQHAQVSRRALTSSQIGILDGEFAQRVGRWPAIIRKLQERSAQRAARLAILRALMFHPRVEARVALLLDHLAQRWGKVSAHGIRVGMPLTHDLLANLTGAARPSVSRALGRLVADGIVERDGKGWRLLIDTAEMDEYLSRRVPPCPPADLTPVVATVGAEPADFSTHLLSSSEHSSQTA